jgi:hypothetical protein
MAEVPIDQLKVAIESQHGGTATFIQSVLVREAFRQDTVWQGIVSIFELTGHPSAIRAYAWSSPVEGTDSRRVYAVLHTRQISSPVRAVRAAMVAEHRAAKS